MEVMSTERMLSTSLLNIDFAQIRTKTGKIIERFLIDPMRNAVAGVVVHKGKIVMIRTKRLFSNRNTWELPGGWMHPGEIALTAIRRKVEEETGFEVTNIRRVGSTFADPNLISTEKFYFFVEVGRKIFKPDEDIVDKVGSFTLEQIRTLIEKGEIIDERTITALMLTENKRYI